MQVAPEAHAFRTVKIDDQTVFLHDHPQARMGQGGYTEREFPGVGVRDDLVVLVYADQAIVMRRGEDGRPRGFMDDADRSKAFYDVNSRPADFRGFYRR